ncbi:hypothetical protein [Salegentibacter chungangensis]|uniref:Uncharacterized protein n=1 Tax=Salegentibacter chungangensis TaxID=1335724 RepID=A0ABW3NPG6_9FLAO
MKKNHSAYHKNPGFKTPDNYFEEFEEDFLEMVNIADSAGLNEAEKLKSPGYRVPEDYFENLDFVFSAEQRENDPKVISISTKEILYYVAGIAAILIAVFGTVNLEEEPENSWNNVEVSALENYIDEAYDDGYIELSTSEVSSAVFGEGYTIDPTNFNELDSDAALDYIDENVEDPVYILE